MMSSSERAHRARENAHWAHVSHGWCDYRPSALSEMELAFHAYEIDPFWHETYWLTERPTPAPGVARRAVGWLFGQIRSGIGHAVAIVAARIASLGTRRPSVTGPARPIGSMH